MAAESAAFDRTCEELEERTDLDRLEARGTVRIALKGAGLDGASVDPAQMAIVLRKVLPSELETRGIADGARPVRGDRRGDRGYVLRRVGRSGRRCGGHDRSLRGLSERPEERRPEATRVTSGRRGLLWSGRGP
jgi:hypothetical protein